MWIETSASNFIFNEIQFYVVQCLIRKKFFQTSEFLINIYKKIIPIKIPFLQKKIFVSMFAKIS